MELLTTAEMAQADRLAVASGIPAMSLMGAAGEAVANSVARRHPSGTRVTVVAGAGNNGGDGFVAARRLAERRFRVRVLLVGDRAKLTGEAKRAAEGWRGEVQHAAQSLVMPCDVVIDALFGAGLDRAVEGMPRAMIETINAAPVAVHSVDLPSGINGTTGAVMGVAVNAAYTVTFFRRKPGHLLLPGRLHCGTLELADIGIPGIVLEQIKPAAVLNAPALWGPEFPLPRPDRHKYTRGHVVVVSGKVSTGAARLAARGALRAGAGLVTIASPREAFAINAAASLAVMVRPVDGAEELGECLADPRCNTVVIGPGGGVGPRMRELVLTALRGPRAVVLDADALTSFAETPKLLFDAIGDRRGETVLTPHEGEFRRIFSHLFADFTSKLELTRAAARRSGAIVLCKGPDTVIAAPEGRAAVSSNAPSWLATAGSGDVLAGILAGFLAQGMPGYQAAAAAAWVHGEAAREVGAGLIAEDLPEALPHVHKRLLGKLSSNEALERGTQPTWLSSL
ncbi:MAG: NAD(P)H-hydrate dehydratase [Xanthobacteraceae bacterium]